MDIASIECGFLGIPFNPAFTHAAASRATTQTLVVIARAADGTAGFGEGCPRDHVTGETSATACQFIHQHCPDWLAALHDIEGVARWSTGHRAVIDANPAAWTAVELAVIDLCARAAGKPAEELLGLPALEGAFRYAAVLGDMSPLRFEAQLALYQKMGFREFKIKLAGEPVRDLAKVRALAAAGIEPQSVRAEADNLWTHCGTAIRDLLALDYPFFAVEEPLRPGDYAGMRRLAAALDTRIIVDESLLRTAQLAHLDGPDDAWIVNLRVSKMGGLLRSLQFVGAARDRGVRVIVGAEVGETSVLTRAAMTVAMQARDILVGQEGAFGSHLLSSDIVERPIMFGEGGTLDAAICGVGSLPGSGLSMIQPLPHFRSLGIQTA